MTRQSVLTVLGPGDLDLATIRRLVASSSEPTLTVQFPTHREPGRRQHDDVVVEQVLATVDSVLESDVPPSLVSGFRRDVHEALEMVDPAHRLDALVVWSRPGATVIALTTQAMPTRVAYGTPLLIDVVGAFVIPAQLWVLVLSEDEARLMWVHGEDVTEIRDAQWPMTTVLAPETVMKPRAFGQRTDIAHHDRRHHLLVEIDQRIQAYRSHHNAPMVLVGPRRLSTEFRRISSTGSDLIAHLEKAGAHVDSHEFRRMLVELRRDARRHEAQVLADDLDRARSSDRVIDDLATIAQMAHQGSVDQLIVCVSPEDLSPDRKELLDTVVFDVVRSGGRVCFVEHESEHVRPCPLAILRVPVSAVPPVPATLDGPK
jgi:hypothetical protein